MTNLPTPELQAAVERLVGMARFLRLEAATARKKAARGNKEFWLLRASVREGDADATDLILAALEARGKALEPFARALKGNFTHQPDTLKLHVGFGVNDKRWTHELGDFRRALTALGGTADV